METYHNSNQRKGTTQKYGKLRIAVVGASMTWGFGGCDKKDGKFELFVDGCSNMDQSFPSFMERALNYKYEVVNLGHSCAGYTTRLSGSSTPYAESRNYANFTAQNWDVVILGLGSNDFRYWLAHNWWSCEHLDCQLARDMISLISLIRVENPGVKIYLNTIWPACDEAMSLKYYNVNVSAMKIAGPPIFAGVAELMGAEIFPIDEWLAPGGKVDCSMFSDDLFHPNAKGYKKIGEGLAAMLTKTPPTKSLLPVKWVLTKNEAETLPGSKNLCKTKIKGGDPVTNAGWKDRSPW